MSMILHNPKVFYIIYLTQRYVGDLKDCISLPYITRLYF